jgi:hypothetical protein
MNTLYFSALVRENPDQRAANVYNAGETTYSAPEYCASVRDALKTGLIECVRTRWFLST